MTQCLYEDTRWPMLTIQGHAYIKKPKTKNKWKCVIPECRGEIAIFHTTINFSNLHNHAEDYNRIAAEFIKEKIVEWGTLNYEVRQTKHLDIIYECLSQNILNYMPGKCQIICLIKSKRRCLRRRRGQQQPQQRKFMFSLDEINDYKVAEALAQSHQRLYEYYVKHGIIRTSNPIYNQQQKHVEISDSMIGVTVPEYGLESFCNNTFDNDNVQKIPYQTSQTYQWNENEGSTMKNIAYPQALDKLASFTVNFDYGSSNENNCQDSSSSVQTLADTTVNAKCILSHPDTATHEHMPESSRLEKAINRLYQKQQQQYCCITNTNDDENLHRSSLEQTYCSLNIDNDMVNCYNFIQSHGFLNAAEASNLNSFLYENCKIPNESPAIYNGNVSSNNIYSMEATENQNLELFITDPTILSILSILDADERRQKLIEYEKKLLPGFEETSKIAKNILKQCQELLENF